MRQTVLYIEDNFDNMVLVRRAIEAIGYGWLGAANGLEGLRIAHELKPDLILLDINLPDVDGYEIARRLRKSEEPHLRRVPILAITANVLRGDAQKALQAGCDAYLSKPLNIHELWARIGELLARDRWGGKLQNPAAVDGGDDGYSYLAGLQCSRCGDAYSPDEVQTYCARCNAPLVAAYSLNELQHKLDRDTISRRRGSMWRWHELLPVRSPRHVVSLGEGDTPTLPLARLGSALGFDRLYLKDESLSPTGSFKARGLSAAVSKAKELGVHKAIIPTAGNAGGALAAYASRAGMQACIFMPQDTPAANLIESRITGAQVVLVEGLISDAAKQAGEKSRSETGWFDFSTFKEPYRLEGKKVMGYEIAEAFDWQLPDVILYPTGGGTGLVGIWKAIEELAALDWLETSARPRMIAVQAAGCAPVVQAVENGEPFCEFWEGAKTEASGLRVPKSFADRLILDTIAQSGGTAVAVSDEAIFQAQNRLAKEEGVFAAPEGAATLAGLLELQKRSLVQKDERILLLNTGSGLKYIETIRDALA
ncbi:MAG: threonine synthase [Anaerolineaceae bacterium]|nr:threonine synthase [Anaerolineaceae bacterium]